MVEEDKKRRARIKECKRTNENVRKRPINNKAIIKEERPKLTDEEKSRKLLYKKLNRKRIIPDISSEDNVFAEYLDLVYNRYEIGPK